MPNGPVNLDAIRLDVVRPDDHVVLSLRFVGVTAVTDAKGPRLDRTDGALIIVELPPQAFAEEAFTDDDDGSFESPAPPPGRLQMQIGGPSRLVFKAPPSLGRIDYSLEGILAACGQAALSTAHQPTGDLFPAVPDPNRHTVVEVPYDVRLSPSVGAGWAHTAVPAGLDGSFALWHTRLGVRRPGATGVDERNPSSAGPGDEGRKARAAWKPQTTTEGFTTSLTVGQRQQLSESTNSLDQAPIVVDRLMLSSLGAWFDGGWEPLGKAPTGLESWRHHMTMGRDHAVRVVDVGRVYPYGHRVARSTITLRKLGEDGIAYLHQRIRLLVREPECDYAHNRGMPFGRVRLVTASTPSLVAPTTPRSGVDGSEAFWPMVSPVDDFLFDLEVEDRNGTRFRFQTPLIFVSEKANLAKVHQAYEAADADRRIRPMSGQRIVYADGAAASTAFDTDSIELTADLVAEDPRFKPNLRNAVASVPALRALTGKEKVGFTYHQTHRQGAQHKLGVFAVLTNPEEGKVAFGPDVSAGMVAPDMAVTDLSMTFGPLGGGQALDAGDGTFDPKTFLSDSAKLFGVVSLADILTPVFDLAQNARTPSVPDPRGGTDRHGVPTIPQLVAEAPNRTTMLWSTTSLQSSGAFEPMPGGRLWLEVVHDTNTATSSTTCEVGPFKLALPLLDVGFNHFRFMADSGKKVDVSVDLKGLEFKDSLRFVNELRDLIPGDGFVDPPALDVTPEGITAGYSLQVPSLAFGIFNLQNLAIGARAHLPLLADGASAMGVGFQIGERQNPFLVSVSYFAGMGFFGMEAGIHGIAMLEGSLEFGGALALSIGVASGALTLTAGIYYANASDAKDALAGFVRCTGAVEVLGLISISAQFYLELRFQDPVVRGTATLTVKVEVLFFSKSVDLTVTREFARSPAPTFAALIPSSDTWKTYCSKFAPD